MSDSLLLWLLAIGVGGTVYAYLGFPLLITALGRRRGAPGAIRNTPPRAVATVIIPAYNEEQNLAAKIRNVLDADYPRELLDIIVVSDASTDRTNDIARAFQPDGVRLIVQERRSGKTAGLNRAVALARGDVIVFTDANAIYPAGTIAALIQHFDRPRVGMVTGYTRYTVSRDGDVGEVTNAYTTLERTIKKAESIWGCCVGADGAIFALRRTLYRTLRNDDINDFVIPLSVIAQGYECVFAEEAYCTEHPGTGLDSEFRRQSRITNRTLRALWRHAYLLNPVRFPVFAFFLLSHKLIRFLVPAFLVLSGVSALSLMARQSGALAVLTAALAGCVLAIVGRMVTPGSSAASLPARLLHLCYAFLAMNLAMLDGWWRFATGQGDVTWQHDRSAA